jgi:Domain of unknown function (DUF6883)
LPRGSDAEIPHEKVTGYLLSLSHPVGASKARYFESRGYSVEAPEVLEASLRRVAEQGEVVEMRASDWGTKYFVVGNVTAPDGNSMRLGAVWMVAGVAAPVLVTAYPARKIGS